MLTKEQLHKLSELDGWEDYCNTKKDLALVKAHEVFTSAKQRGELPGWLEEPQDAQWVQGRRLAKHNKVKTYRCRWYPEYDEIAKQYGFADAFDIKDVKALALEKAHEVFKRAKQRGALPNKRSKGKQEKIDGGWLSLKKQTKLGRNTMYWYPEYEEIALKYGFSKAFDIKDNKAEDIKAAHDILKRAKKKGFLPLESGTKQDKKDRKWISRKREAKKGKGGCFWYDELDDIAKEYGFENAFNLFGHSGFIIDKEDVLNKAHEIFSRAKQKGILPSKRSVNKQEAFDGLWIQHKKKNKFKEDNVRGMWYPELDDIAKQYNFSSAFEQIDVRQNQLDKAHEVFARAKQNGELPTGKNKDAYWINDKRRAKAGTKTGASWYPELEDIAIKFGFPDAFDIKA